MIVGGGMLARALAQRYATAPEVLVFASGVSNSTETDPAAFARERALLEQALRAAPARLVYFSTCSVEDPDRRDTPYVAHKRAIETLLLQRAGSLVLRLPQAVGRSDNPHTLTNHLYRAVRDGLPLKLWTRARRNLVDVDDIATLTAHFIAARGAEPAVLDIASPNMIAVTELVRLFERLLDRQAVVTLEDRGDSPRIAAQQAWDVAARLGISFDAGYEARVLEKYYGGKAAT